MKLWSLVLSFALMVIGCSAQTSHKDFVNSELNHAVAELYTQNSLGVFVPVCTATAFDRTSDVYSFVTASHCVSRFSSDEQQPEERYDYFLRVKTDDGIAMLDAYVMAIGCSYCGDDFAVLLVETKIKMSVVPLGVDPSYLGEEVYNMAAPMGGGKQFLKGYVTSVSMEGRPHRVFPMNWDDYISLDIPVTAGGSSGSAVICAMQEKICGILVGTTNYGKLAVAAPVSRFVKWYKKTLDKLAAESHKP